MQPKLILSASQMAHRLGLDRRAVLRRLTKHGIEAAFITDSGEAYFDEAALQRLEVAELEGTDSAQSNAPEAASP